MAEAALWCGELGTNGLVCCAVAWLGLCGPRVGLSGSVGCAGSSVDEAGGEERRPCFTVRAVSGDRVARKCSEGLSWSLSFLGGV